MLLAAILLGALPSLSNAFIAVAVGFLTELTCAYTFYKVLLCLHLASAFANWLQHRADTYFDAKFSMPRAVHAFRIFLPALLLSLVFISLGELLAYASSMNAVTQSMKISILALVAVAGFCAGSLSGVGAVVVGSVGEHRLVWVWIGVASSGLLCIVVTYALGFTPDASERVVRQFFLAASVLVVMCMAALGSSHFSGELDEAYERASSKGIAEAAPMLQEAPVAEADEQLLEESQDWTAWIQGASSFMTVFLFPLLPLLCSASLAQELVVWKLAMDFIGPLTLLFIPIKCPLSGIAVLIALRAVLLVVTLWLLSGLLECGSPGYKSRYRWCVACWDMLMLIGAFVGPLNDTCASPAPGSNQTSGVAAQRLRKNRFAMHAGICIGLMSAGTLMYTTQGHVGRHRDSQLLEASARTETRWSDIRTLRASNTTQRPTCSTCADPDPQRAAVQAFPCGGKSDEKVVKIFHYGANMGCKKLKAIGVEPHSAQAVYIPGRCLRFGTAEGVPTSTTEPGYGNLVPCEEGCVHGMLHKISGSEMAKIDATEPGYYLATLPEVVGYNGQRISGVQAYVMKKEFTARAPSRRYGGLLYCSAKEALSPSYAKQLACAVAAQGTDISRDGVDCKSEEFMPLAAQGGSFVVQSNRSLRVATAHGATL